MLIDFDGIIRLGTKIAPDAKNFLEFLVSNNIPSHLISNASLRSSAGMNQFLAENNIHLPIPGITAIEAAANYVSERYNSYKVYCSADLKHLFQVTENSDDIEAIIVGDLQDAWSYETMNEIFRYVLAGCDFIAVQKNKFWKPDGKTLCLDSGSFLKAIEFASGKEATLVGKPSPLYFQAALKKLGFEPDSEFYMIGDDLDTDIKGANEMGAKSILVYTGKTEYPLPQDSTIKPHFEAKTLTDVIEIIKEELL